MTRLIIRRILVLVIIACELLIAESQEENGAEESDSQSPVEEGENEESEVKDEEEEYEEVSEGYDFFGDDYDDYEYIPDIDQYENATDEDLVQLLNYGPDMNNEINRSDFDFDFFDRKGNRKYVGLHFELFEHLNLSATRKILFNDEAVFVRNEPGEAEYMPDSYVLNIFEKVKYDNTSLPQLFRDIPVTVGIGLKIYSLTDFDVEALDYEVSALLVMKWRDYRLMHNFSKPILVKDEEIMIRIWRPDLFFVNAVEATMHDVTFPNYRAVINQLGLVTYSIRLKLRLACPMVFCRYPHDKQICNLTMSSISYQASELYLNWFDDVWVELASDFYPSTLQLVDISGYGCSLQMKPYADCLNMRFGLSRDGSSAFMAQYLPSIFGVAFAWIAPYTPLDYVEVLITLGQMEKDSSDSPKVSYLKSVDVWFSMMKLLTLLALLESLFVMSMMNRADKLTEGSEDAITEKVGKAMVSKANFMQNVAKKTEFLAKILPPMALALFSIWYNFLELTGNQREC